MGTTNDILKDIAESLRGLPELVEALRENTASREKPVQRDRLDEAILAMVKLKKPSQRAIADAIGLKSHSSLKDIDGF